MSVRTRYRRVSLAVCVVLGSQASALQAADKTEAIEQEAAIAKAKVELLTQQAALAKLQFGEPITGKSGEVENVENYGAFLGQRSLFVAAQAGRDLGQRVSWALGWTQPGSPAKDSSNGSTCKSALVTESTAISTRLREARTIDTALDKLESELEAAFADDPRITSRNITPALTAAQISGLVGSVVSVVSLFQADYSLKSVEVAVPPELILANTVYGLRRELILTGRQGSYPVVSDALPVTKASALATRLEALSTHADDLLKQAKTLATQQPTKTNKARVKRVDTARAAIRTMRDLLLKPDDSHVAPAEAIAPYFAALSDSLCVVRIVNTTPAGMVFTKATIFGKGGRIYGNLAVQLAAVVTDSDGYPIQLVCAGRHESSQVKMAAMTKPEKAYKPVHWVSQRPDFGTGFDAAKSCAMAPDSLAEGGK